MRLKPWHKSIKQRKGDLTTWGYLYYYFHSKWSKLCTAPHRGPKNSFIKKKILPIIGPVKNVTFSHLRLLPCGIYIIFFVQKWIEGCTTPHRGPKISFIKKNKLLFDPLKWFSVPLTLFPTGYLFLSTKEQTNETSGWEQYLYCRAFRTRLTAIYLEDYLTHYFGGFLPPYDS